MAPLPSLYFDQPDHGLDLIISDLMMPTMDGFRLPMATRIPAIQYPSHYHVGTNQRSHSQCRIGRSIEVLYVSSAVCKNLWPKTFFEMLSGLLQ